jgi:acetyl esterase
MPIDPEVEAAVSVFPHLDIDDPVAVRAVLKGLFDELAAGGGWPPVDDRVEVADREIPGPAGGPDVPVRIFTPRERSGPVGGFVHFHGGGFVLGNLDQVYLRGLSVATDADAVMVSVDYRLAPEHPFPAGVDDCYAALLWVHEHADELGVDLARLAVGGESAGGALAAVVAQMARDRIGPALAFQLLAYPVIDNRMTTASVQAFVDTPVWDGRLCEVMWRHYLGDGCTDVRGEVPPYAAPGRAESLAGLPPAYLMTCELDPLRDEGIEYAMRLMHAGVPVELHNYAGTVHGFDGIAIGSEVATRAVDEQIDALRRALAAP